MLNSVSISNKINKFNYTIDNISGDKSLSIRWALMASQAVGKSKGFNILNSESKESTSVRLLISLKTRDVISLCSELLGIDLPNKM